MFAFARDIARMRDFARRRGNHRSRTSFIDIDAFDVARDFVMGSRRDDEFFVHFPRQASHDANAWAERRREALERAKALRETRQVERRERAHRESVSSERERLRERVERAEREANERNARRDAEALAAKIREGVEREMMEERRRADAEAETPGREAPTYASVKGPPMEVLEVDVIDSERTGRRKSAGEGGNARENDDERGGEEEALVSEWSPPKASAKMAVKVDGKRYRSPLSANGDTLRVKARPIGVKGSQPSKPPPPTTAAAKQPTRPARPAIEVSKPGMKVKVAAARPMTKAIVGVAPSSAPQVKVAMKKSADGEKVLRQMFDKRESRRMNRGPFSAAVRRWRNRQGAVKAPEDITPTPTGSIFVYARKRPLFEPEKKRGEYDVVSVKNRSVAVVHNCQMHADLKRMFVKHCAYDLSGGVFDETAQEHEVYARAAAPLVLQSLQGGVAALFMYGQTGSGKTHTMESIEKHAFEAIFMGDGVAGVAGAVSVGVSYFEIAGKSCFDLLQRGRVELRLKELFEEQGEQLTTQMEVELMGANEPTVSTAAELKSVIEEGKSRRQTSSTQCNASSSRSHAVLRLTVTLANGSKGRLTLVDCAGSERKEDNVKHNEQQRKETAEINASLYALKECVRFRRLKFAAGKGAGNVHVPYRNSPLTRVLAECFVREDASMAVIGTMSPASTDTEHSLATLKTINAIGGHEDTEGYSEEKEDVSRELRIDSKTGEVTESAGERLIAPVKWSHDDVRSWFASAAKGAFESVKVPSTLTGSQFVRMTPLVLKNMCNGDEPLSVKLHKAIRAEIMRCSAVQRP